MLDLRPVSFLIGLLLVALGLAMLVPLIVDLASNDSHWTAFAASSILTVVVGSALVLSCMNGVGDGLTIRQTFILTISVFSVLPVFGALPFLFGATGARFVDAFFEAMSGLTTTGATVLTGLDDLPAGLLLWRGLLQWIGGIGIIIVAMAFLPLLRVGGMQLFRSDSYDSLGTILPRVAEITRSISLIYLALSVACFLTYSMVGLSWLDSAVHAMTTIATGGFANYDDSFAGLGAGAEYVGAGFMIVSALPFIRYVQLVNGSASPILMDSQIRSFLIFCAMVVGTLGIWQFGVNGESGEESFRRSLFNGISILTGTGFVSDNFAVWGSFPVTLFFLIGLVGGCAGSTSCAIKIFRFQLLIASIKAQVKRIHSPHGIFTPRYEGNKVPEDVISSVMAFFVMFLTTLSVVAILLAFTGLDAMASISGAAAALANIGPGLGDPIGPTGNYSSLSDSAKWLLSGAMLIGRLELMAVFAIISGQFWKG
ncbi:MAG: TrkH family potassium uptake protein [Albidovulum sp.]|nr:TrkH family potassium uptake protein [Albidovulum sp.]